MTKANIKTKDGTIITIEGTPEEVAKTIKLFDSTFSPKKEESHAKGETTSSHYSKISPVSLIGSLIDGGFFKKPKDLSEVKHALEELGHVYPVTSLSPALLRLVRRRQLRRLKEKKRWLYTGYPLTNE
jgi:hypothetical protein